MKASSKMTLKNNHRTGKKNISDKKMIEPWDYFLENTIQPPLPFQKWPNCNVQKLMQKQYFNIFFIFLLKKFSFFFRF